MSLIRHACVSNRLQRLTQVNSRSTTQLQLCLSNNRRQRIIDLMPRTRRKLRQQPPGEQDPATKPNAPPQTITNGAIPTAVNQTALNPAAILTRSNCRPHNRSGHNTNSESRSSSPTPCKT
ncbi:MAG UNVERIFIED_CONTAM: hypothetical protein LVR18_47430 [Planctomycetaceae bacterium]|jgi:hypothetical protein